MLLVFIKLKILASYRLLVLFMTGILYWRYINWFFFHELVIWKCWFHLICLKSRATLTMFYFLTLKLDYTNWTISRNTLNSSPVFTLHCLITLQDCASFGFSCELLAVVTLPNFVLIILCHYIDFSVRSHMHDSVYELCIMILFVPYHWISKSVEFID